MFSSTDHSYEATKTALVAVAKKNCQDLPWFEEKQWSKLQKRLILIGGQDFYKMRKCPFLAQEEIIGLKDNRRKFGIQRILRQPGKTCLKFFDSKLFGWKLELDLKYIYSTVN